MATAREISIRHDLVPGDIGRVVELHGTTYAREYGFDAGFEAYVAGPLASFVLEPSARQRIWLAEQEGRLVGCIAIVPAPRRAGGGDDAQLRWFLVAPAARGAGLGRRLMQNALDFCREQAYSSVFLWTVHLLHDAARLYRAFGFERVEERPQRLWSVDLVEERYVLALS